MLQRRPGTHVSIRSSVSGHREIFVENIPGSEQMTEN